MADAAERLAWIGWARDGYDEPVCEWTWAPDRGTAWRYLRGALDGCRQLRVRRAPGLDGARRGTESASALRTERVIDPDADTCDTCGLNDPTGGREPHFSACSGCRQCGECGCDCEWGDDG